MKTPICYGEILTPGVVVLNGKEIPVEEFEITFENGISYLEFKSDEQSLSE